MGFIVALLAMTLDLVVFIKVRGRQDNRIAIVWDPKTAAFSWGSGEVRVPRGFSYKADLGMDTVIGHFTAPDGTLVIEHDIGELAAEHGGMASAATLVEGSRVRIGRATYADGKGSTKFLFRVSFPDSGCAHFALESANEADAAIIEFIAKSFRPLGRMPGWIRPLLPEVVRSDCRYRFRLPVR